MKITSFKIKVVTATIDFDELPKEGWAYGLPKGVEYIVLVEYENGTRESYAVDAKEKAQTVTVGKHGVVGAIDPEEMGVPGNVAYDN